MLSLRHVSLHFNPGGHLYLVGDAISDYQPMFSLIGSSRVCPSPALV